MKTQLHARLLRITPPLALVASLAILFASLQGSAKTSISDDPLTLNQHHALDLLQEGSISDAIELMQKEIAIDPKNGYTYYILSALYSEDYQPDNDWDATDKAIKYLPKSDKESRAWVYSHRAL